MSRLKLPSVKELIALANARSDICLSIYMESSPLQLKPNHCRQELRELIREALGALDEAGFHKLRLAALNKTLEEAVEADDFCPDRGNSLALLATPDAAWTYHLPNQLIKQLNLADRFYLKPLFQALTFAPKAYILALSENAARVIGLYPGSDPESIKLPIRPSKSGERLSEQEMSDDWRSRKKRLNHYIRQVNTALETLARQSDRPFILVAEEPLAGLFRDQAKVRLSEQGLPLNPEQMSDAELIELARPALDRHYQAELNEVKGLLGENPGQKRVALDVAEVAKAATRGLVSLALVDFDQHISGYMDANGNVEYSEAPGSYGLIDEIVKRSLEGGARILAVRHNDMIGDSGVAAVLRQPL